MSARADVFRAELAAFPSEADALAAGSVALDELLRDLIRAYAPPNVQYERERIIEMAANPRELAFVLGLLNEGENEAALLLDLMHSVFERDPHAPIGHLADEAWYYLRTSIDETWQLDDGPPSVSAALAYLHTILCERLDMLEALPAATALAAAVPAGRADLLRSLRGELTAGRSS